MYMLGRAIAQAVSRWLPTAAVWGSRPGLSYGILWWTEWRWGRFSPSTSVSPAKFPSTNCSKNHPYLSSGVCTVGQSGRSTRDLDRYLGTQYRPTNNNKKINMYMLAINTHLYDEFQFPEWVLGFFILVSGPERL
jgi:hypothetical protein